MKESAFKLLQRGNNSQIFLHQPNIVLKMVDVNYLKQTRHLKNQYDIMKGLHHKNILRCLNLKENIPIKGNLADNQGCFRNILLLEYAQNGSLLNYIKNNQLKIETKRNLVRQLSNAVQYLHNIQHVAHRDIKLDNILVKEKNSKITILLSDFGFALKKDTTSKDFFANSYKGTKRGYMAPELHLLMQDPKPYSPYKLDIFSLGVVIFCIFFNKLPFQFAIEADKNYGLLMESTKKQEFWLKHKIISQFWPQFPMLQEFKSLLEGMWEFDPSTRFSIDQVKNCEWMKATQHTTTN